MKKRKIWFIFVSILLPAIWGAFPAGASGMHEDVDVKAVTPKQDTAYEVGDYSITLEGGTTAFFYEKDGAVTDRLYQGQLAAEATFVLHGKEITVPAGQLVWFFESGHFKYTTGISEQTSFLIQGKEVEFLPDYDLYVPMGFHENGHLASANLAQATTFDVQDTTATLEGQVTFSDAGAVTFGQPVEDVSLTAQGRKIEIPPSSWFKLFENGDFRECSQFLKDTLFLVQDTDVLFSSRPSMTALSAAAFHENGNVLSGTLANDTAFRVQDRDITFRAGTAIILNANQQPTLGTLAMGAVFTVQGKPVPIPSGSSVEFDEEGELIR